MDDNVQFIDVPEFAGFCLSRTGHTGQLVVHTEIVLERDGREGLRSGFHLDALFRFDGLVQAVRIAASLHDTTRLLVDNHHFVVDDHIFVVFLKQRVGFQQLVDGVDALALDRIVGEQFIFLCLPLLFVRDVLQFGKLGGDVGQDEELWVVGLAGQQVDTFVGQLHAVVLLVDDEIEFVGGFVHVAHVFRHEIFFRL